MAHVIAVAGKGGVGKTTLTGLIIQNLGDKGKVPSLQWMRMQTPILMKCWEWR